MPPLIVLAFMHIVAHSCREAPTSLKHRAKQHGAKTCFPLNFDVYIVLGGNSVMSYLI